MIKLSRASIGEEEKQALARVVDAGYLGMGEEVRLFEGELENFFGGDRHVICVSTGTAALQLAVSSLGLGPGDEVIIPSITYVASFQAVSAAGATPVACDVRKSDVYLDIEDAKRRLTQRTRAIMPVHYASGTKGLHEVYAFAREHSLRVIEDAAHSFGGEHDGKRVGTRGDVVCFSFDGIKNITAGEGGAIVTSDDEVARRARDARLLGVERDTEARFAGRRSWSFEVHHQGFRYHMSNLHAALGRAQMMKVQAFCRRRRELAARYRKELAGLNAISMLDLNWHEIVPHIFVVRVLDGSRDALREALHGQGIETGFHYQPNHKLAFFSEDKELPQAELLAEELLTIPLHAQLTDTEQTQVIDTIRCFMEKP